MHMDESWSMLPNHFITSFSPLPLSLPSLLPPQALQAAAREKMELALQQQSADSAVPPSPLGENHGERNNEEIV